MFRDKDTPVLIDFGAAYALTAEHSRTVAAFEMPGFSPIEQYSVTGQNYGPWTDLYAVGAVLYRAMTELVPVGAPSRIERDELAPVARVAKRKYGKQLTGAVDWALKLRAADRPQSIAQWRRVLDGRSRPPGLVDGSIARVSGKRLAMIVVAATLVIAAGAWWTIEPTAPDSPTDPLPDPVAETPDDDSIDRKIARVRDLVEEGEIAEARRVLEEARVLGLHDDLYQAFSAAIDEADNGAAPAPDPQTPETLTPERPEPGETGAVQSLSGCAPLESERRWEEALECVRRVIALDEDNAEAREKERNLEMLAAFSRVHDEPSVEGYYQFIKDYPWSHFVDAAGEGLKELENAYWEDVKAMDTPDGYRRYLEIYPAGRHADEARSRLSDGG